MNLNTISEKNGLKKLIYTNRLLIERIYLCSIFLIGVLSFFWLWGKNVAMIITLVSGLFLIDKETFKRICKSSWFIKSSLLLFIIVLIGVFYGPANLSRSFSVLTKYRRLLFPLLLIPAFVLIPCSSKFFLYGVTIGIIGRLVMEVAVRCIWGLPLWDLASVKSLSVINPIYVAFDANLCAVLALFLFQKKNNKTFLWIYLLASIYICFINPQKVGFFVYIIYISLLIGLLIYYKRWKLAVLGFLGIAIVLVFQCVTPFSLQSKFRNIANEIDSNNPYRIEIVDGTPRKFDNSLGMRLNLIQSCIQLVQEKPLLGWGTGGFASTFSEHKMLYLEGNIATLKSNANPHNQFALITVESGLVGLFALLFWLWSIYKDSISSITKHSTIFILCFILIIIISFFADVLLFINISGDFLMIIASFFIAETYLAKDYK